MPITRHTQEPLPQVVAPDIDRCVGKRLFDKTFSACAAIGSVGDRVFHHSVLGTLQQPPPLAKVRPGVLFDLGTLTQPLATTLAALYLVSHNRMDIRAPLSRTIPEFRDLKFDNIRIDMLLDHTAGFPSEGSYWQDVAQHDERSPRAGAVVGSQRAQSMFKEQVAQTPLVHQPGGKCLVSNIGFLVLGWVVEYVVGKPLDQFLAREIYQPLGIDDELFFIRLDDNRSRARLRRRQVAATEDCAWRDQVMQAEVHDRNAWALGGVAGHAGLFGTAEAVWRLCRHLWAAFRGHERTFLSGTVRRFWTRSRRVRGTTRALGWDTPAAHDPSAGKRFSKNAVGHLGSTGGSIWIDLSTNVLGVVLTNAVHPTLECKDEALKEFRPRMYDLIAKEGEALGPDPDRPTGAAAFS